MTHDPRILALSTAVPPHVFRQRDVMEAVHLEWIGRTEDMERMLPVFDNAGIDTRYSCVPMDWLRGDRGWPERSAAYVAGALDLLERVTADTLTQAGVAIGDVDALVTVSTTGVATPSLDALLAERLAMRRTVTRLPIFGLGCAGGVLGLCPAAAMARGGRSVLFIVVELCGLTFRCGDTSKSNIIAAALFGDGAAAVLLRDDGDAGGPTLGPAGAYTWPGALDVMGWNVEDDGLGVLFSRDIPNLVRRDLRTATDRFLARHNLSRALIDGYACHPGGIKVIEALEDALELPAGELSDARDVLRDYGNMSAATVLFVLERAMARGMSGRHLMLALGPGFTAGFQVLDA